MRNNETTRQQLKEVNRSVKASKKEREDEKKEMKRNMLGL
jgi:hypothetical protein